MKLFIKIKINSKIEKVIKLNENNFTVSVRVPPIENKANIRLIELLSEYLNIPKSRFTIIRGIKSKNKVIEIV